MLIEINIPNRDRRWTTGEVQEYLNSLARKGKIAGPPWGQDVQPYMQALGEAGAFGPDWVKAYQPRPRGDEPYISWREAWNKARSEPEPAPAPKPQPKPEPAPKPDPVIQAFTAPRRGNLWGIAPHKPKPPEVSLWQVTPEQEAAFNASAARALPLGSFNGEAEYRSMLLAGEARFQDNLARIAEMRIRRRVTEFGDLGELAETHFMHVVGWNRRGYLPKEQVRKERLREIDD